MGRFTLKRLWANKGRLLFTLIAVFLGVSFLSGTLVLNDTMRKVFDDLFSTSLAGTDAVIQADTIETSTGVATGLIDESLLAEVRQVDGVARAEPAVEGYAKIIGSDGKPVGTFGPPTFGNNWIDDPDLNPYRLAEGRLPVTDTEVVIDKGAADAGKLAVGDTTTVQTPQPLQVVIVGISTFGSLDSQGGTTTTSFTLDGAQAHLTRAPDKVSTIVVAADPGVNQEELVSRLTPLLPAGVEAKTGEQVAADLTQVINEGFLDFFTTFLLIFAVIALVVATFIIYNTFSIIVAQRSRESALLRAIGASRRQVLVSAIVESALVGIIAAVLGILGGFGLALALKGLFGAIGLDIPAAGLALRPDTLAIGLTTGIVVTVLAGLVPAVRASRIPPIAALREVAIDTGGASVVRLVAGVVLTAGGVITVLVASARGATSSVSPSTLIPAGIGAAATVVGMVVLGPVAARPTSRILGAPVVWLRGVTGKLARQSAERSPTRTAGSAAALMVGVAVVTLFTVTASSLKASVETSVGESFAGDLVVTTSGFAGGGFSPDLANQIGALTQVSDAAGVSNGAVRIDGDDQVVAVADLAKLDAVFSVDTLQGDIGTLTPTQLAVADKRAADKGWQLGSTIPVTFADGTTVDFTVGAIYGRSEILGGILMPRVAWDPHASQTLDVVVLVKLAPGVSIGAGRTAVEAVTTTYPGLQVQDRQQYVDTVAASVNQILLLVYVMLFLAVVIALIGIVNTLGLSIYERTRELGLLRAVGQTRRQVRSMVRWEAVIIAVFGTLGGLAVGVFLGWGLVRTVSGEGLGTFDAAPGQLALIVVIGATAGVLAAVWPARKASRIDMLRAIATE